MGLRANSSESITKTGLPYRIGKVRMTKKPDLIIGLFFIQFFTTKRP